MTANLGWGYRCYFPVTLAYKTQAYGEKISKPDLNQKEEVYERNNQEL